MRHLALACLTLLTVAGCDGLPAPGKAKSAAPLAKMSFANGDVVVAGPEGYCLDRETTRSLPGGGVAVIASCLILTEGKAGVYVPPAMVTVTIGPRGTAEDLPTSAALAKASGAPLLAAGTEDGLVMARLGRGGESVLDGGDPGYWRGAFLQGGRVIGLALYAPQGDALAGAGGAQMLRDVRAAIRSASGGDAITATSGIAAKPRQKSVVSRLFGR